ncbi:MULTISPECIES: hypothetical protein [Caballeronia]|uniref:hypothetical protein n=1 Tax=Caballeronia TaxID=1827195 RepID=UPI001FD1D6CA|nr:MULTISPECIES: hypothetical protein [Caballeronia]MDR5799033.1 hypothetical protein [Caballeronia sp. LZ001]
MKRLSMVLIVPVLLSACGEHAQPGSSLAARYAAAEFVGKAYNVDPVRVKDEPVIVGETANVTTEFDGGTCKLVLVKQVDADQYGWLAKKIACNKTA